MINRQFILKGIALKHFTSRQVVRLPRHAFHTSRSSAAIKPFLLSDPGEGIKEVQIVQWFVKPGERVAEFDKVCEIASDKAMTEITSRYEGVIKELHYEADDFVQVGEALLDIDVQNGDVEVAEDLPKVTSGQVVAAETLDNPTNTATGDVAAEGKQSEDPDRHQSTLATPAVRGFAKQNDIEISDVEGKGKDGRILKEDVQQHMVQRESATTSPKTHAASHQVETAKTLTPAQTQMLKTMTRSLSIPHFLYTDEIDLTSLSQLRSKLNVTRSPDSPKVTTLAFIIKAVSLTLAHFPLLNARLDEGSPTSRPQIYMRYLINIGVAIDTPTGLLVPNIKDVASLSINEIAIELSRLQKLGQEGKLARSDLQAGTITVSNIGSIGGMYVSPLIVKGEVAILGIGREKTVPGFDEEGNVVKKKVCAFSWSADHRLLDGAYVARAAENVRRLLEEPGEMIEIMR